MLSHYGKQDFKQVIFPSSIVNTKFFCRIASITIYLKISDLCSLNCKFNIPTPHPIPSLPFLRRFLAPPNIILWWLLEQPQGDISPLQPLMMYFSPQCHPLGLEVMRTSWELLKSLIISPLPPPCNMYVPLVLRLDLLQFAL